MFRGPTGRGLVLWLLFVAFCAVGMANPSFATALLPVVGRASYYQVLLLGALVLGVGALLWTAGSSESSVTRTMSRIVMAYCITELLLVLPIAYWIGRSEVLDIVAGMQVRATWLLFPVMVVVCSDERARRWAGVAPVIAAAAVVLWGAYVAATGSGYYFDEGELRYRILFGGAAMLVAWPFVLALSGAVSRRYTISFLALAALGLAFTNHRSGFLAFACAGVLCLVMAGQLRRVLPAMVPVILVAAVAVLVWGSQLERIFGYTLGHLVDRNSANGADRLLRWGLAWEYFLSRPFNDWVWSWRYYLVDMKGDRQPHNFFFEILITEGVVGLVFYGSLFWTAFRNAWAWAWRDAEARALIGWLVAYVLFMLMNANHYLPTNLPLLVAAVAALVTRVDWLRRQADQELSGGTVTGA
jgi:O-antigen ligase